MTERILFAVLFIMLVMITPLSAKTLIEAQTAAATVTFKSTANEPVTIIASGLAVGESIAVNIRNADGTYDPVYNCDEEVVTITSTKTPFIFALTGKFQLVKGVTAGPVSVALESRVVVDE